MSASPWHIMRRDRSTRLAKIGPHRMPSLRALVRQNLPELALPPKILNRDSVFSNLVQIRRPLLLPASTAAPCLRSSRSAPQGWRIESPTAGNVGMSASARTHRRKAVIKKAGLSTRAQRSQSVASKFPRKTAPKLMSLVAACLLEILVSAEGIESALKRTFNNMQVSG